MEDEIDWNQRLKDNGLRSIEEVRAYRETVGWVPYNEYMGEIYYHCPSRELDEFNMSENFFDKQLEPDKLLRETAYLLSIKHRPCHTSDSLWTEEDQLELEESLYNKLRGIAKEWDL